MLKTLPYGVATVFSGNKRNVLSLPKCLKLSYNKVHHLGSVYTEKNWSKNPRAIDLSFVRAIFSRHAKIINVILNTL